MIKNDREKQKLEDEIKKHQQLLDSNRDVLRKANISEQEIAKHVEVTEAILAKLNADLDEYNKLKAGELPDGCALECIGEILVKLRISQKMSQKELAEKINVNETQLSRYERTGYRGSGIERIKEVLEALGVHSQISFEKVKIPVSASVENPVVPTLKTDRKQKTKEHPELALNA
jgi:transcriptional regulator with XRE-family HTH domain